MERAGDYNQRVTLQAIRVHNPITRSELSELTGLTAPAIANITKRLLQEGLIIGSGRVQGGRGQPPTLLSINPDGCYSIGVNIDRDHITVVVMDLIGNVRARATKDEAFALPRTVAEFFHEAIDGMIADGELDMDRVIGVGVAIPDLLSGLDLPERPADYSQWDNVDIASLFGAISGPVLIENDATAAAMGELQFGHGLRQSSFFYLLISAGLGGGLVINGTQYRGAHGRSGEIGVLPLRSPRTPAQDLGQAVSLSGLYDMLRRSGIQVSQPDALMQLGGAAAEAAITGWVNLSANLLADPLIAVCCLLDPQAIYIGGRMPAEIVGRLADRLNQVLPDHIRNVPALPQVQRAAMAQDAPAIGAALLPFNDRLLPTRAALLKMA